MVRRKHEVIRTCEEWAIPILDQDYDVDKWDANTKGLEDQPEGGFRCNACFRTRLSRTAQVAAELGFVRFGSTLTTGRYKKASIIANFSKCCSVSARVSFLHAYGIMQI